MKIVLGSLLLSFLFTLCLSQSAKPPKINAGFPKVIYFRGRSDQKFLDCTADGIPSPTYKWYKDGVELTSNQDVSIENGKLSLNSPTSNDEGRYQCFAENQHGKSMSTIVNILKAGMDGYDTLPITTLEYTVGEHALLECRNQPHSVPTALVDWFLSKSDAIVTSEKVVLDQSGSLHFLNVEETDQLPGDKTYNCSLYNSVAQLRVYGSPTKLIVQPGTGPIAPREPSIQYYTQPKDAVVLLGETVTLQCIPSGYPLPTVRWSRASGELPQGRHEIFPSTYKLEIHNVTEMDEGNYECTAVHDQNQVSQTIFVDVKSEPIWVEKLRSQTVTEGTRAQFDCVAKSAAGENDNVIVQWFKNGDPLASGTTNKITVSGTRLIVKDVLKPYELMNIQCNVSNTIGYQMADAFLNVILATELTVVPEKKILIDPGKTAEVRVAATADPLYANRLSYRWTKDGAPVSNDRNAFYYVNAANSLIINATKLKRDTEFLEILGNFSCKISLGLEGGVGDRVTYTHVSSNKEKEIIAEAAADLWWIAVIVAVVVLIIIIILICCCLYRNRGGTYPVDEKERRAGHDPEKELADSGFQDLSRADAPDEKKPYGSPDQVSLTNDPPLGGDTDSLDEYGEPDSSKFNEDGSFIGNYGGRKGRDTNQSTV